MDALVAIAASVAAVAGSGAELARPPVVTQVGARGGVITWSTTAPAPAVLTLGGRVRSVASTTRASIAVDGLVPGRRYAYAVRAGVRVLARGSFRTAPRATGRAARFTAAVFGDSGSGDLNQRAVVRLAASWRPDLTVLPGDIIYPLALDGLLASRFFAPMRPLLRRSGLVLALGNHDTTFTGGRFLLDALELPPPERWYLSRYGSAAFLVLDSNARVDPASRQGRFIRRAVRAARTSCLRIAVLHHPPFSSPRTGIAPALRRHVVPLLERAGFQLVLVGHVHSYERSQVRNGITYVVVGPGGAEIGRVPDSTIPSAATVTGRFGALRLDVAARGLTGSFTTVDGVERDRFGIRCA